MNFLNKEIIVDESHLNTDSQLLIASLVKSMPDDELSMSWRSDLNVKLLAAQSSKKKLKATKRVFGWGLSLSGSMAVAVAAMIMSNSNSIAPQVTMTNSNQMASEFVKAHQESIVLASVSGISSSTQESTISEESYSLQDDLL